MVNHEYSILPYDAEALSDATLRARHEVNVIVEGLRKLGGPWESLELVATAEQIGVRDGRRIRGRDTMVVQDLIDGNLSKDGVARVTMNADIHNATRSQENEFPKISRAGFKKTTVKPYDIRLGALIAKDVDGLLLAGRCISGDFIAHSSYRVTGNAVAMGEAAGIAGAMAASKKLLPHQLDYRDVIDRLSIFRS